MSLHGFLLALGGSDVVAGAALDAGDSFFRGFHRSVPWRTAFSDGWLVGCDLRANANAARAGPVCSIGGITVCFDGWLENAAELATACRCAPDATAAEMVLAAWRIWGDELASHLVGEYSLLLWDSVNRRLLAVRDKVGVRPLFYATTGDGLVIGNLPGAVAAHPAIDGSVDLGYAAEFLCVEESSFTDTLYAGVQRLCGGHQLTWRPGQGVELRRYWQPSATVHTLSSEDAPQAFAVLLQRAVAGATRDAEFVGCDLSGGIDSTSVALQLARMVREGQRSAVATAALSLVYPGLPCDESPYIDAVAGTLPFPSHRFNPRYADLGHCEAATAMLRYPYFPYNASGAMPITDFMAARGGVLLSGEGGDELFEPTAIALRGALWSGHQRPALRRWMAQHWSARGASWSPAGLARYLIEPFAGRRLQNFLARWRDRPRAQAGWPVDRAWAQQVGLSDRVDSLLYPRNSRTLAMACALSGAWSPSFEWIFLMSCVSGVESRHPLSSAALIEFCNRLPLPLLDGQEVRNRVLLRQAGGDALPSIIGNRTAKAEFTPATLPALLARVRVQWPQPSGGDEAFANASDGPWFRADVTAARHIWRLDAAASFDLWLRALPPSAAGRIRVRVC